LSESAASTREFDALQSVIRALQPLDEDGRRRIIDAVTTFLDVSTGPRTLAPTPAEDLTRAGDRLASPSYPPFSDGHAMSPKEFLLAKQPRTDVERIAVLAYYLTHYRDMQHFRTLDLSKLNTEAAQPKFSNAASSANNAVKTRYLVPSTKGNRQLSAAGERFVEALPDREAARQAMAAAQPRRRARRPASRAKVGDAN
jgi:hypothetical protein